MSHMTANLLQILHPYFLQIYLLHPYLKTTLKYVTLPSSPIPLHATRHPLVLTHVHLLLALNPTLHFPRLKCPSNLYPLFTLPCYLIIHPSLLHLLPTRAMTPLIYPLPLNFIP